MNYAYKKAMESLHLSPEARGRITEAMERARPLPRHRVILVRPALIAAALAVVLTVTAVAAGAQLAFFHQVPEDVAETLQPVQRESNRHGLTLNVQSAGVSDGRFRAYVTLKDNMGDRLSEESVDIGTFRLSTMVPTDFWNPTLVRLDSNKYPNGPYIPSVETGPISYDEESGTYGFLLEYCDDAGREIQFASDEFFLEVYGIYAGRKSGQFSLSPVWPDASQEAETAHVALSSNHYRPQGVSNLIGWGEEPLMAAELAMGWFHMFRDGADLLAPGESVLEIAEDYDISAIGWLDGKLHIQERASGDVNKNDRGSEYTCQEDRQYLVRPDGSRIAPELIYHFYSEDNTVYYEEAVYDVSPEELAACTLGGAYRYGGVYIDGYWCVKFSLDEPETK